MYGYNSYSDNLAREKRRRFFVRILVVIFCLVILIGAGIYAIFYSGWLDITSISFNGLRSVTQIEISSIIDSQIEKNIMSILNIRLYKNTLSFDPKAIEAAILNQFPVIKNVKVSKDFLHNIAIDITERTALGTWCFNNDGSTSFGKTQDKLFTISCRYFDEDGVLWGEALKSSGTLLLVVDDFRLTLEDNQNRIESKLLEKIMETVKPLNDLDLKIRKIEITADSIDDFRAYLAQNYYLIFTTEFDINTQVKVLKIFLSNQSKDFNPEYIDLRIEGRVYYK